MATNRLGINFRRFNKRINSTTGIKPYVFDYRNLLTWLFSVGTWHYLVFIPTDLSFYEANSTFNRLLLYVTQHVVSKFRTTSSGTSQWSVFRPKKTVRGRSDICDSTGQCVVINLSYDYLFFHTVGVGTHFSTFQSDFSVWCVLRVSGSWRWVSRRQSG